MSDVPVDRSDDLATLELDDPEVAEVLTTLRSWSDGPVPTPRADLAHLLAHGSPGSVDGRRGRTARRTAAQVLLGAGLVAAGVSGAAASDEVPAVLREPARSVVRAVLEGVGLEEAVPAWPAAAVPDDGPVDGSSGPAPGAPSGADAGSADVDRPGQGPVDDGTRGTGSPGAPGRPEHPGTDGGRPGAGADGGRPGGVGAPPAGSAGRDGQGGRPDGAGTGPPTGDARPESAGRGRPDSAGDAAPSTPGAASGTPGAPADVPGGSTATPGPPPASPDTAGAVEDHPGADGSASSTDVPPSAGGGRPGR